VPSDGPRAASPQAEVLLARQPILDDRGEVYGYELLARRGWENAFRHTNFDEASMGVLCDTLHSHGLDTLTGGKRAFINLTRQVLVQDFITLFPPDRVVVEVLESVEPAPEVLAACARLKQAGYLLALDDFVDSDRMDPLLPFADILKIDVLATAPGDWAAVMQHRRRPGLLFLAEKVETRAVADECRRLGFALFQGYYFARPTLMPNRTLVGNQLQYLRMLEQIHRAGFEIDEFERVVKNDLSLSYKLLRYINSAFFGWKAEIRSIRQALVALGEREFKKWASLVVLVGMASDKPLELVLDAIIRARMCERIAQRSGPPEFSQGLFLLGLFSLLDAILERPLADCLQDVALAPEIKAALLGEPNHHRSILDAVIAYEGGDWEAIARQARQAHVPEQELAAIYWEVVAWAQATLPSAQSPPPQVPGP
jgi:c-di-GMP-related signal transduction protein